MCWGYHTGNWKTAYTLPRPLSNIKKPIVELHRYAVHNMCTMRWSADQTACQTHHQRLPESVGFSKLLLQIFCNSANPAPGFYNFDQPVRSHQATAGFLFQQFLLARHVIWNFSQPCLSGCSTVLAACQTSHQVPPHTIHFSKLCLLDQFCLLASFFGTPQMLIDICTHIPHSMWAVASHQTTSVDYDADFLEPPKRLVNSCTASSCPACSTGAMKLTSFSCTWYLSFLPLEARRSTCFLFFLPCKMPCCGQHTGPFRTVAIQQNCIGISKMPDAFIFNMQRR